MLPLLLASSIVSYWLRLALAGREEAAPGGLALLFASKEAREQSEPHSVDYCCTMVISSDGGRVVLFYRYFLPSEHVGDETLQFFQRNSTHYLVELLKHQQVGRCDDT